MTTLRLGDTAPDFTQDSTAGPIHIHEWAGDQWVVLFSRPADFTPVCTTKLRKTAAQATEFAKRIVKPIAVIVNPIEASGCSTSTRPRTPRSTSRSWPTRTVRWPRSTT